MKVLIYNKTTLVGLCEDNQEFDIELIKGIYGDGEYFIQEIDMSLDDFRKYNHLILDGKVVVDFDSPIAKIEPDPVIPEPTLEEKLNLEIARNKALADRQEFLEDIIAEMAMMVYG